MCRLSEKEGYNLDIEAQSLEAAIKIGNFGKFQGIGDLIRVVKSKEMANAEQNEHFNDLLSHLLKRKRVLKKDCRFDKLNMPKKSSYY